MLLILASGSPRRRELLTGLGLDFDIHVGPALFRGIGCCCCRCGGHVTRISTHPPHNSAQPLHVPDVDERTLTGEAPESYVRRLAREKALEVAGPGRAVLAADTTVVHGGSIIGKPADRTDARRMLARLEGETHTVFTGAAVVWEDEGVVHVEVELDRSDVRLVPMTDGEVAAYVDTGEPLDKAGAYALQGIGGMFVAEVRGSPSNVIGLPLHLAVRLLRRAGIKVLGEAG